jgi:O-antigen ligase
MHVLSDRGIAVERASRAERTYDFLSLLLLMWPATGGMWLMGSTRVWGYAPGLVVSFCGSLLLWARPLVFPRTPRWWVPPGWGLWAVLTAYVAAGVGWAVVPYAARWEALRWICLLLAAFSWTQLGGRAHRWKWLLGVLLLAVALDCLYAWIQHVNGSRMVLWAERPEQYGMRASGTYLCPNHFANMIAMLVPLALVLVALPEAGFPLRMLSLYFLVVALPPLYWSHSRSGWLGMAGGVATALVLLAWRRSRAWLLVAMAVLPLLAAAAGFVAWKTLPAVRERMGMLLENPEKAGGVRMQMWRDAPAMIQDQPVRGFGGGSYPWAYPPYQRHVVYHLHYDFVHNEFIQLAIEYGAAGLGLALLALLACAWGLGRAVLRTRSREAALLLAGAGGALVANLVHALFDFNFHIFPNPHALVWVGGVAWGVWAAAEVGREAPAGRRRHLRRAVAALGAALCALGAWLSLSAGVSYVWNLKGDMARSRLDWDAVEAHYRAAMRWDALNWKPHSGLGHFKASQALWYRDPDRAAEQAAKQALAAEATRHFGTALEINPLDMAVEFGLARALNAAGDTEAALEHFRRAAAHQRRHIFYREQLGVQLRRAGRDDEALEVFRQNVADRVYTDVSQLNIRALERKRAREAAAAKEAARQAPAPVPAPGNERAPAAP